MKNIKKRKFKKEYRLKYIGENSAKREKELEEREDLINAQQKFFDTVKRKYTNASEILDNWATFGTVKEAISKMDGEIKQKFNQLFGKLKISDDEPASSFDPYKYEFVSKKYTKIQNEKERKRRDFEELDKILENFRKRRTRRSDKINEEKFRKKAIDKGVEYENFVEYINNKSLEDIEWGDEIQYEKMDIDDEEETIDTTGNKEKNNIKDKTSNMNINKSMEEKQEEKILFPNPKKFLTSKRKGENIELDEESGISAASTKMRENYYKKSERQNLDIENESKAKKKKVTKLKQLRDFIGIEQKRKKVIDPNERILMYFVRKSEVTKDDITEHLAKKGIRTSPEIVDYYYQLMQLKNDYKQVSTVNFFRKKMRINIHLQLKQMKFITDDRLYWVAILASNLNGDENLFYLDVSELNEINVSSNLISAGNFATQLRYNLIDFSPEISSITAFSDQSIEQRQKNVNEAISGNNKTFNYNGKQYYLYWQNSQYIIVEGKYSSDKIQKKLLEIVQSATVVKMENVKDNKLLVGSGYNEISMQNGEKKSSSLYVSSNIKLVDNIPKIYFFNTDTINYDVNFYLDIDSDAFLDRIKSDKKGDLIKFNYVSWDNLDEYIKLLTLAYISKCLDTAYSGIKETVKALITFYNTNSVDISYIKKLYDMFKNIAKGFVNLFMSRPKISQFDEFGKKVAQAIRLYKTLKSNKKLRILVEMTDYMAQIDGNFGKFPITFIMGDEFLRVLNSIYSFVSEISVPSNVESLVDKACSIASEIYAYCPSSKTEDAAVLPFDFSLYKFAGNFMSVSGKSTKQLHDFFTDKLGRLTRTYLENTEARKNSVNLATAAINYVSKSLITYFSLLGVEKQNLGFLYMGIIKSFPVFMSRYTMILDYMLGHFSDLFNFNLLPDQMYEDLTYIIYLILLDGKSMNEDEYKSMMGYDENNIKLMKDNYGEQLTNADIKGMVTKEMITRMKGAQSQYLKMKDVMIPVDGYKIVQYNDQNFVVVFNVAVYDSL